MGFRDVFCASSITLKLESKKKDHTMTSNNSGLRMESQAMLAPAAEIVGLSEVSALQERQMTSLASERLSTGCIPARTMWFISSIEFVLPLCDTCFLSNKPDQKPRRQKMNIL